MVDTTAVELGRWTNWHAPDKPLRLGVSTCLLGENVRFDGGHARDRFVTDTLGQWFEYVPVCPEVDIGMGTPRPTVRLVDEDEGRGVQLLAPKTGEDFTERMTTYSEAKTAELQALDLDGYVLKKGSPSCGMARIRVYRKGTPARRNAAGLFAATLMERWPTLPVEEEGRLNDPVLRENFIERAFCRNRWRVLVARGLTRRRLVDFHTAHKLLIRAHNEAAYRRLGKLVAAPARRPDRELFAEYETGVPGRRCSTKATRRRSTRTCCMHALGYLKRLLGAAREARDPWRPSRTSARASCRWSCRSRSCATTGPPSHGRWSTWPASSTSTRTPRS